MQNLTSEVRALKSSISTQDNDDDEDGDDEVEKQLKKLETRLDDESFRLDEYFQRLGNAENDLDVAMIDRDIAKIILNNLTNRDVGHPLFKTMPRQMVFLEALQSEKNKKFRYDQLEQANAVQRMEDLRNRQSRDSGNLLPRLCLTLTKIEEKNRESSTQMAPAPAQQIDILAAAEASVERTKDTLETSANAVAVPGLPPIGLLPEAAQENNVRERESNEEDEEDEEEEEEQAVHDRAALNDVAAALKVGEWIAFHGIGIDGVEDPHQPLWIGRVMSNPVWDGNGVLQNTTRATKKYAMGVEVQPDEVAINVQWYEKTDPNSDELKYHVSRTATKPQVQNNAFLLQSGFVMKQLCGDINPVPRGASRQLRDTTISTSERRRHKSWHDKEVGNGIVWEMAKKDRESALGRRESNPFLYCTS